MREKKNTITKTIRAAPETISELKRLTKELGFHNQGELLDELLATWKFQKAREASNEFVSYEKEIRFHLNAISYLIDKSSKEKKELSSEISKLCINNEELKKQLEETKGMSRL